MAYTTIDKPTDYFNTVLFSGNETARSITGVGFQPDWVWIKDRSQSFNHHLFDVIRGATKRLKSDTSDAESTNAQTLTAFGSDGFSLGTDNATNGNGSNVVSWNWKAGTSFTNDASSTGVGTIDSTGSINTTAGFSIISYTGTGSAGSIAHGLGVKPDWILSKDRTSSGDWNVYHDSFSAQERIKLNSSSAKNTNSSIYASLPTSSVINVGTGGNINTSGNSHIFYCFASKKGYSKFGSYTGNGDADGTFVYTGFKPAWVVTKSSSDDTHWNCKDNKRSTFNPVDDYHKLNEPTAEDTATSSHAMDFLSNGFKHRGDNSEVNGSGRTYIYMAFAETPFVTGASGIPTTAR